jgi:hypothetical protein
VAEFWNPTGSLRTRTIELREPLVSTLAASSYLSVIPSLYPRYAKVSLKATVPRIGR